MSNESEVWLGFVFDLVSRSARRSAEPRRLANARADAIDAARVSTAVLGSRVYVIAGFFSNGASSNLVEAYDTATNTWAGAAPLPIETNHNAAATVGNRIYAFGGTSNRCFSYTANKSIVIRVGPNADSTNSREVTVVPIGTEVGLRNLAWIEGNRRKVDELSGGKVGYVYLPDTGGGGFTNFNRYYFAQIDKQGAVIDERFNGGGTAADYIVDYMRRPLMNYWTTREGEDFKTPVGSIFGPKAMIINEYAGSGGDLLPWLFRKAGVGQLVGKRTWGGLVGIYTYPQLMDGGQVTAPPCCVL